MRRCFGQISAFVTALCLSAACSRPATEWRQLGELKGCTPELLARTPSYDSSRVMGLVGEYRLVLIDTAAGWLELRRRSGTFGRENGLTLWKSDSLHRHWRVNPFSKQRMPADRPVMGQLSGFEKAGFTSDNPQVTLNDRGHDYLTVVFSPNWLQQGDGATIWSLPISREGAWGFGGYFREGAYVVPSDVNGNPLGQRAGFYCAIRVK